MGEVYRFANMDHPRRSRVLSAAQVTELHRLLERFPAIYSDLSYGDSSQVYASDACPSEDGVSYCDMDERELADF